MIRINLLPVRAVKKQELGRKQLFLFALVLVAAGIGNFYWYKDRSDAADRVTAQVASLNKEISELDRIIGEVKNISTEKQQLEEKLKVLDTLKKGRTGPVKMLDSLATVMPKNVWIKKLDDKSGAMSIEGGALSNDDVAEFMKAISSVVWTPSGIGRLIENRRGATSVRVELHPSGEIMDFELARVKGFFRDITLKKTAQSGGASNETKVVDFSLSMMADYAI